MSAQRWLNCPKREVKTLSPGFRQLVRTASQQPVPDEGKRMGLPEVVLNTGFRALRQARVSSGKIGERWSSIATAMARRTRSGTLVGPGTNRKLRPAMINLLRRCGVVQPLAKLRQMRGIACLLLPRVAR